MSTPIAQYKLPSRIEIGFDSEAKASIADLKNKLDEVNKHLSAKDTNDVNVLLKAMKVEAVNDEPNPEPAFQQLGQWVFEGHDEKWMSAAVNTDGRAYLHNMPKSMMYFNHNSYGWCSKRFDLHEMQLIEGYFNPSGFVAGFIERETINDVEYLSEVIDDECDWRSESAPQITQADMQLIFIKNLSECIIQRMHSMERFSTHDSEIGHSGGGMMAWDIIFDKGARRFGLVTALQEECIHVVVFFPCLNRMAVSQSQGLRQDIWVGKRFRTITENELGAFRAALEVCYA